MFLFNVCIYAINRLTRVTFHGNDRIVPKQEGVEANKCNGDIRYHTIANYNRSTIELVTRRTLMKSSTVTFSYVVNVHV